MSDAQRGKYILLLCLQHQQGLLTEDDMINICKTYDEKIFKKFIKKDDGFYYNERMKIETDRRKKYSESRSKNRKNICQSYDKHMETETITITKNKRRCIFKKPTIEEVKQYFYENNYSEQVAIKAFNYYETADWHDSKGAKVKNWKQKMQAVWFKEENKKKPEFIMP